MDKEESDKEESDKDREEDKVIKRNKKGKTLNLDVEKTAREVEEELTNDFMVVEEKSSKEKCTEWVQKAAEAGFFFMPAQEDVEYVEDEVKDVEKPKEVEAETFAGLSMEENNEKTLPKTKVVEEPKGVETKDVEKPKEVSGIGNV